jgi:hypothetical protein
MRSRSVLLVVCALALSVAGAAQAQYSIDWYTIDGGGGTSSGGPYTLSGTIGQPDADVVSLCSGASCVGATYELTGGFWAGIQSGPVQPGPGCGADLNCIFRSGFEN